MNATTAKAFMRLVQMGDASMAVLMDWLLDDGTGCRVVVTSVPTGWNAHFYARAEAAWRSTGWTERMDRAANGRVRIVLRRGAHVYYQYVRSTHRFAPLVEGCDPTPNAFSVEEKVIPAMTIADDDFYGYLDLGLLIQQDEMDIALAR